MSEAFAKADRGKRRFSLVPPRALAAVVDVLEHGARKYAPGNWARCAPAERIRYFDAAVRHLEAWRQGEAADAESGLPAHAVCCVLFLLAFQAGDAGDETDRAG
jgi:hypothetical protein